MSIIFFDGFDYYNSASIGTGGKKWDQGSQGTMTTGRFGGQALATNGNGIPNIFNSEQGYQATLKSPNGAVHNCPSIIVGFAMLVNGYFAAGGGAEFPSKPFFRFNDLGVVQCSLWINHDTQVLEVRQGDGISSPPVINTVLSTSYVPPIALWVYLECKINFVAGNVELFVDGVSIGSATGVDLKMTGNSYCNRITLNSFNNYGSGATGGSWTCDDLYVIDSSDAIGNVDCLGEVRVQTKVPDADGYQNDWLRSQGLVNSNNVNTLPVTFADTTKYNYSGTVGAIDLYSIQNFTVSGTIFAVQENIAFKKDDVGNRKVSTILRTAAQNYTGTDVSCYSNYTYNNAIWEKNPATSLNWDLTDLNLTEFGIKVTA